MKNQSLTSKGVVRFAIPAIVEVVLVAVIIVTMIGAHRSDKGAQRIEEAKSKLDAIYYEVTSAAIIIQVQDDIALNRWLPEIKEKLRRDAQRLREIRDFETLDRKSARDLPAIVDDLSENIETLDGARKDGAPTDFGVVTGKVGLVLGQLRAPVETLRERLTEKQKQYAAQRETLWSSVILLLVLAMLIPVAVALNTFVFAGNLSARLQALRESVLKISLGEQPAETTHGKDEISALHSAIYELSVVMERARQKERAMIDNAGEIICSLDESLRLSEVNPAVERRLGYKHEELIGTNIQSLIHSDDRDETYNELESIKHKPAGHTFETRLKHSDGGFLFTEWSANWSNDDRSILCVIHDITDRKKAEQLKQDVIAMVSHDLRAPLTSIGVTLDMVLEGAAGDLNDRGRRLVGRAQLSVASLISMIKDLLDIERYEAGGLTLNLDSADARDLVIRAIDMVKAEAERKRLELEIKCDDVSFVCDAERVNRILVNLINNAVKFSKEGKTIFITAKLLKHRSQAPDVEFQIIDEGPGIPQNKVDTIFDKFTQVGTGSAGERVGSGLGLAICKALVEAHQGKIGVNSAVGEGTTFWFRLPQVRETGSPAPAPIEERVVS